jgi:hypothetical protein
VTGKYGKLTRAQLALLNRVVEKLAKEHAHDAPPPGGWPPLTPADEERFAAEIVPLLQSFKEQECCMCGKTREEHRPVAAGEAPPLALGERIALAGREVAALKVQNAALRARADALVFGTSGFRDGVQVTALRSALLQAVEDHLRSNHVTRADPSVPAREDPDLRGP